MSRNRQYTSSRQENTLTSVSSPQRCPLEFQEKATTNCSSKSRSIKSFHYYFLNRNLKQSQALQINQVSYSLCVNYSTKNMEPFLKVFMA